MSTMPVTSICDHEPKELRQCPPLSVPWPGNPKAHLCQCHRCKTLLILPPNLCMDSGRAWVHASFHFGECSWQLLVAWLGPAAVTTCANARERLNATECCRIAMWKAGGAMQPHLFTLSGRFATAMRARRHVCRRANLGGILRMRGLCMTLLCARDRCMCGMLHAVRRA